MGLQNALWELGGVIWRHRTDHLSSAVHPVGHPEAFTDAYRALAAHYGFASEKIQPACPHENGDVEQRHYRFKKAAEQALLLRGSRDFASRAAYAAFLGRLFDQLNAGRQPRLREELKVLRRLPARRLEDFRQQDCRVGQASTIRVLKNSYSVHSRLIGQTVTVRIYAEHLEVWYAQRKIEPLPRLRGAHGHHINYRHVIDWLVRKPGAFENYRYKEDLFPSSQFRMAYDLLRQQYPQPRQANRQYLKLLELAARENQTAVNQALRLLIAQGREMSFETVEAVVRSAQQPPAITDVHIPAVDLQVYDQLLEGVEVSR